MKLHAPALLAVVVPQRARAASDTVTVGPSGAVPVSVTESLALTAPLLMTGAGARPAAAPSHRARSILRSSPPPSCRWR